MQSRSKLILATVSSMVIIGPLNAQNSTQLGAQAQKKAADPGEVICEKQEVVGSRLATRRICMTRQQWAEQKLLDRQDTEKTQVRIDHNPAG